MIESYSAGAIRRARQRAKDKGLPFTLSERDFAEMMEAQRFRCAVTGMPFPIEAVSSDREKHAFRPSVDRIAPAKGYTRENVRLVCEMVNFAMSNWGEGPLLKMVEFLRVANPRG